MKYKLKIKDLEIRNMNWTWSYDRESETLNYLIYNIQSNTYFMQNSETETRWHFCIFWKPASNWMPRNLSQLVFHSWSGWNIFVFNQNELFMCTIFLSILFKLAGFVAWKFVVIILRSLLEWNQQSDRIGILKIKISSTFLHTVHSQLSRQKWASIY